MSSLADTAKAVMVKWCEGVALDVLFADAGSAVDDVTIISVSEARPAPSAKDQRRESLDPLPLLAPSASPPLYVKLSFNYRGYAKSLPWPVWTATSSPFRSDKLCPIDADWMLVAAKAPESLATAPTEQSALDKLSEHGPQALADLANLTKLAGWGILAYLGAQAFGLVRAVRRVAVNAAQKKKAFVSERSRAVLARRKIAAGAAPCSSGP